MVLITLIHFGHILKDHHSETMPDGTGKKCSTAVLLPIPPLFTSQAKVDRSATNVDDTTVLSVLAADSLLGAISTGACAYDSDRGAVGGQERANKRYIVGNTQEAGEYIEVGLGGIVG